MRHFQLLIIVFISAFALLACSNDDSEIDATERMLIDDCSQNQISTKQEIASNLIGDWELIGYGSFWPSTRSMPKIFMKITVDELIFDFEDDNNNVTSKHDWDILEDTISGIIVYRLGLEPMSIEPMGINSFCADYMYGDATPVDGNLYILEKVD